MPCRWRRSHDALLRHRNFITIIIKNQEAINGYKDAQEIKNNASVLFRGVKRIVLQGREVIVDVMASVRALWQARRAPGQSMVDWCRTIDLYVES